MKQRLAISFSGGRTSAVMTKMILEKYADTHEIVVTFANTGWEHPATLDFVKNCDDHFGFKTVWLEAQFTHGERVGVRHKIVTHETASRDGTPFREYIKKHGIPNMGNPACTGRLKEDVMKHFLRHGMGWPAKSYVSAIGIRADEADRMSASAGKNRLIYPLVKAGITKQDVIATCKIWPFDLELPGEHYGNCVGCWKKSLRKLLTVAKRNPEFFAFPKAMDDEFGTHRLSPATVSPDGKRKFFRKHMSTQDILDMAQGGGWAEYGDTTSSEYQTEMFKDELDIGSGCGESCEIGADTN